MNFVNKLVKRLAKTERRKELGWMGLDLKWLSNRKGNLQEVGSVLQHPPSTGWRQTKRNK